MKSLVGLKMLGVGAAILLAGCVTADESLVGATDVSSELLGESGKYIAYMQDASGNCKPPAGMAPVAATTAGKVLCPLGIADIGLVDAGYAVHLNGAVAPVKLRPTIEYTRFGDLMEIEVRNEKTGAIGYFFAALNRLDDGSRFPKGSFAITLLQCEPIENEVMEEFSIGFRYIDDTPCKVDASDELQEMIDLTDMLDEGAFGDYLAVLVPSN